ncbi:MAG: hypothetical protein KUG82_21965 [Pseudomonadales bacterium]|nr:hypothetical protein [Pseudomonadales bacterium]
MNHSALQTMAITDLHPSWIQHIDGGLISLAVKEAVGRRWIADNLSRQFTLFQSPPASLPDNTDLEKHLWLLTSFSEQMALLLEIGATACQHALRTLVSQNTILQLHEVLSSEIYHRVIQSKSSGNAKLMLPASNTQLRVQLYRYAYIEVMNFVRHQFENSPFPDSQTFVRERIALSFPASWYSELTQSQLYSQSRSRIQTIGRKRRPEAQLESEEFHSCLLRHDAVIPLIPLVPLAPQKPGKPQ